MTPTLDLRLVEGEPLDGAVEARERPPEHLDRVADLVIDLDVTVPLINKAVGGSFNYNIGPDGNNIYSGYTVNVSETPLVPNVRAGASATATETHILSGQCAGR